MILLSKNQYDLEIDILTEGKTLKNLYEIAQNFEIVVYESNLGSGGGLYLHEYGKKIIIINSTFSYYHKMIILAHEIAHATIHPYEEASFTKIGMPKSSKKEREANYFTCKLLDAIGFWDNESLCVHENELTKADLKFLETYKNYLKGCNKNANK